MPAAKNKIALIERLGSFGLRRCGRCFQYLPIEIFYIYPDGDPDCYCTPCKRIIRKEWRDANPEKVKEHKRGTRERHPETPKIWAQNNPEKMEMYAETNKKKRRSQDLNAFYKHGIRKEETELIYEFQEGCCFICGFEITLDGTEREGRRIDHSYTTGLVRGLLCQRCNVKLGWYEKRAERIQEYLDNPPAQQLGLEITTDRRRKEPGYKG